MEPGQIKTTKGQNTRARILESALTLFRERGYEQTTMRTISEAAEVSLGNLYYYFKSKEVLIQAFYARTHEEHLVACSELLEQESDLHARLLGVMRTKLDTIAPYHPFAGVLFRTAADPGSPLNPFSDDSGPVRDQAVALFAEVVSGSSTKVRGKLGDELPGLLWIFHMSIILHWIHDRSDGCARSYVLVDHTCDLVVKLIKLAKLPVMRPLVRRVLTLMAEIRSV